MRDGLARHIADGEEHVPADGWWQVDVDHACGRHEEDVLVGPVCHYVGATAERLDSVASVASGVRRGAPGCRRERREFRAGCGVGRRPQGGRRGEEALHGLQNCGDRVHGIGSPELFSWCSSTRLSKARHLISAHDHTLFSTYFRYLGFKRAVSNC